jgi:polyhydroxyalkanoate synthesis regulator phasin
VIDMLDDLRTYVQMATGITEATTAKAKDVISGLLASGIALTSRAVPAPDMVGQVQELADDLVATSRNNRELLTGVIRSEVDKAVGRMGFVREDELAALRRHVQRLEAEVHEMKAAAQAAPAPTATAPVATAPVATASGEEPSADEAAEPSGADSEASAAKPKKKKILVDPEAGA